MPRTFDRSTPDDDHSPLRGLLNFDEGGALDFIGDIGGSLLKAITEGIPKILKALTGLDFSSVEAFIESLIQVILNAGTKLLQLAQAILQPFLDIIDRLFGGIGGKTIDFIGGLLGGLVSTANSGWTAISSLGNVVQDLWGTVQQIGGTILGVIQETAEDIILKPLELVQSLWFWFTGLFGMTTQSNSRNNPAITTLEGDLAALKNLVLGGTATGGGDDFNAGNWNLWQAVPGITFPPGISKSNGKGYWSNGGAKRAAAWKGDSVMPVESATGHYRFQMAVWDFGYGRSRMGVQWNAAYTNGMVAELARDASGADLRLGYASALDGSLTQVDLFHMDDGVLRRGDVLGIDVDESTIATLGGVTYTLFKNNEIIGTPWLDTGSVVGSGAGHRRLAALTNMAGTSLFPGCGWDVPKWWDIS